MPTRFVCRDRRRRAAVRFPVDAGGTPLPAPLVNGIDHLEVDSSQRTLFVHFVHPLPGEPDEVPPGGAVLTRDNVRIEGGVRVTGIGVLDAHAAGEVLTVEVDTPGDRSTYRLSVATSPTDPAVPPGFDTALADVDFSFKVDCPSDFDCGHREECPAPVLEPPAIDYLAKDYASFRRLMLDRLAQLVPDWTERNPADVGVALVEALAYTADHLSYFQDAVATEAYLGTARRRTSVRRHARLLDYPMHDGASARAWVCLEVSEDLRPVAGEPVLPAGTMLLERGPGGVTVGPEDLPGALAERPVVFETLHDVPFLTVARNAVDLHTWSDARCCLPRGATGATLAGTAADLELVEGDVLVFEEVLGPESGLEADADPSHRHAVRLDRDPVEAEDRLTGEPVLEVSWHAEDALPFPLCLWEVPDGAGGVRKVGVARANVVLADHGRTVRGTEARPLLDPATVPEVGRYRPVLADLGLTHHLPHDAEAARPRPAAEAMAIDLRRVRPALRLTGDGDEWLPERDLIGTDRFDPKVVVEMEEDGRAFLRVGDGVLGRAPSAGAAFVATYRIGTGRAGNVGARALGRLVRPSGMMPGQVVRVWNPLPAAGGTDPEPVDLVRLHAPQAFRGQERAVTEADYVEVSGRHREVQRAAATRRWTGSWHTMFVTADRRGGAPVDRPFEEELTAFLEPFRLAGHDVEIDPPRFVPLDLALTVCVKPGYLRADVHQALLRRFGTADLPGGGRGFFHPDNFTFGQPVYLSRVVAAAMEVPGVEWVDVDDSSGKPNRFRRWGEDAHGEIAAGRIDMDRLEIARLDNDPNRPENGHLEFHLRGGL